MGEHLLPGQIGNLLITISLIASGIASFAYFKSFRATSVEQQQAWKKLGRIAFFIDAVSVIAVFITLYLLITNHRYEYFYIFKNSGNDLSPKYILSSLWSASEGSFILWTVWHGILGLVLIATAKKWEAPVMMTLSFVQFCLSTMLIGLFVFNFKIGASPFVLSKDMMPVVPPDGLGLAVLLQNYWMVIHPPILFLGFASTIIPFAFAMGGLITRDHSGWIKPALPWALFSLAVLGVGIMMGAAWAYESLSFGGYWAWDPVENASLVPWLVLVAGVHTMVIYKSTGRSLRSSYLFVILTFIFVLYSTFLTRSGVLSDSSVHSFANLGINFQLGLFVLVFLVPAFWLFFSRYKTIPSIVKEEETSSREFWMFIAALIFFFSALVIIGKTSFPIFHLAAPKEAEYSYNSIMVWVAFILGILTAVTQYLKYKKTPGRFFTQKIAIPTAVSVVLAALLVLRYHINYHKFGVGFNVALWMTLIAGLYAVVANGAYIWIGLKGKLKIAGGSISHVGFGLVLVGIIISSANKETLSHNLNGIPTPLGPDENPRENLTLVKGLPTTMAGFDVTYTGDSLHPNKSRYYYFLDFKRTDGKEAFRIMPNAFVNYRGKEGLVANPDAHHYWDHDVFVYLTSIADPQKKEDTVTFKPYTVHPGDSVFYSRGIIVVGEPQKDTDVPRDIFGNDGYMYKVPVKVFAKNGSVFSSTLKSAYAKGNWVPVNDTITAESLILRINKANDGQPMDIGLKESDGIMDYVTIKAYRFPFIMILWLGVIVTAIGILVSMADRIRTNRRAGRNNLTKV